ncbi:MAG: 30S ribosomal protein S17 [Thermotogae bacterium]|jgi:small subunit ribosomal protein S17|nr:30S ribosomal protein S17 [Thermotogota bacterium]MCL5032022.1 30S ribosomal protein S17 [Thermotogota bacterium]
MRKHLIGEVVSNKMKKTIVVLVKETTRDPRFGKIITKTAKYKAHDENNESNIGDIVEIEESRPLSREKNWTLVSIVKKNILKVEETQVSKEEGAPQ